VVKWWVYVLMQISVMSEVRKLYRLEKKLRVIFKMYTVCLLNFFSVYLHVIPIKQ